MHSFGYISRTEMDENWMQFCFVDILELKVFTKWIDDILYVNKLLGKNLQNIDENKIVRSGVCSAAEVQPLKIHI